MRRIAENCRQSTDYPSATIARLNWLKSLDSFLRRSTHRWLGSLPLSLDSDRLELKDTDTSDRSLDSNRWSQKIRTNSLWSLPVAQLYSDHFLCRSTDPNRSTPSSVARLDSNHSTQIDTDPFLRSLDSAHSTRILPRRSTWFQSLDSIDLTLIFLRRWLWSLLSLDLINSDRSTPITGPGRWARAR